MNPMKRKPRSLAFATAAAMLAGAVSCIRPDPNAGQFDRPFPTADSLLILPTPREWSPRPGLLLVRGRLQIDADVARPEAAQAVEMIRAGWPEYMSSAESDPKILVGVPGTYAPLDAELKARGLALPAEGGDEAYLIDLRVDGVVLAARGAPGLTYGAMTLLQMIHWMTDVPTLVSGTLRDWPAFADRGVWEDLSSGQVPTLAAFKTDVARLARQKLNLLALDLGDAFRAPGLPAAGPGRDLLLPQEAKEMSDLARDLHVRLVPVVPVPGGMGSDGKATESAVRRVGEVADAFPGGLVFLRRADAAGAGDGDAAAVRRHLGEIDAVLRAKGKRGVLLIDPGAPPPAVPGRVAVAWAPVFPRPELFPESWSLMPRMTSAAEPRAGGGEDPVLGPLRRSGRTLLVLSDPDPPPAFFPRFETAFPRMEAVGRAAFRERAGGILLAVRTGEAGALPRELWSRGILHHAECAWNPKAADAQLFRRKYGQRLHGCGHPGWEELYGALETLDDDLGGAQAALFFEEPEPIDRGKEAEARIQDRAVRLEKAREWLRRHRMEHTHPEDGVLDVLDHALDGADLLMDMLRVRGTWGAELKTAPHPTAATRDRIAKVAADLLRWRDKYQALWLRSSRPEGVKPNLERLDKLHARWLGALTK